MNQFYEIDIDRVFYLTTGKYNFFLSSHGSLTKIVCILGYRTLPKDL